MAKYRITAPDGGTYEVTAPDDATQEQVLAYAQANYSGKAEQGKSEQPGMVKSAVMGVARGAKDVVDTGAQWLASGFDKLAGTKEGERVQQMNDTGKADFQREYGGSTAADIGRLGGNIAATWPVGGVLGTAVRGAGAAAGVGRIVEPMAQAIASGGMRAGGVTGAAGLASRGAGGAVSGGAMAGLVDPESAATGVVIGAATPAVIRGSSKVFDATARALRPEVSATPLARRALEMGAPLGIADLSNNGMVRGTRSILNDSLFTGGIGRAQNEAKQAWFNQQVGKTFGADAKSLTPEIMDTAKKRLGNEFDRIWGGNDLMVDNQLLVKLSGLRQNADLLPQGEGKRLLSHLDDFESRIAQGADGAMVIPGGVANRFQSSLRKTSEGAQGFLKNDLLDMRQSVISAFNRSVSPQDAAALTANRGKYKAMKTVEPLLQKSEAGVAGRTSGDVPPALLSQAVVNSYKGGVGGAPLTELSQIGQRFLVDRTPQTGGSARAAIQNTALGGALAAGALTNPYTLLGIPAAMGVNKALGSPALARGLLTAPESGAERALLGLPLTGGLLDLGVRAAPLLSPALSTSR